MEKETQTKWILIVEDEKPLLNVIQDRFEKFGFETVTARSVKQAREYLADIPNCSVIWLDHYLIGKETGLDLVAQIKNDPALKHIPVFIVTNTGLHNKEQTYLELGAEKYFIKSNHKLDEIIGDIKISVENN